MMRLWSLWAKGRAVDKSRLFATYPRQVPRFAGGFFASELSTKSTALFLVSVWQLVQPWGHQARGRAKSVAPIFLGEPERLLGPISPHFCKDG